MAIPMKSLQELTLSDWTEYFPHAEVWLTDEEQDAFLATLLQHTLPLDAVQPASVAHAFNRFDNARLRLQANSPVRLRYVATFKDQLRPLLQSIVDARDAGAYPDLEPCWAAPPKPAIRGVARWPSDIQEL